MNETLSDMPLKEPFACRPVNRTGAPYPSYFESPDVTVATLTDLADHLA